MNNETRVTRNEKRATSNEDKMITYFYVEPENVGKDGLKISGDEAKHIISVCRYKEGDEIFVVDGEGKKYKVKISSIGKNKVEGRILSRTEDENEPDLFLTLAQSIGKGFKMDWVVEKGTEIGVSSFIPLITEKTLVKVGNAKKEKIKWVRKHL